MAEKSSGVRELSVIGIGTSTPSIKSSSNLNLSASTVAVGATLSVGDTLQLVGVNTSLAGTAGTTGDIRMFHGAPFIHDGTAWREFYLKEGVPVTESADTEWDNVIYRNTFDSSFTDLKFGQTAYDTYLSDVVASPRKFGDKALRLRDGYIRYQHRSEYVFDGDWTIEGWIYFDTLPSGTASGGSGDGLITKQKTGNTTHWAINADLRNSGYVDFSWYNSFLHGSSYGGAGIGSVTNAELLQTWNHFAVVREPDNGSIHFYFNGVESVFTINDQVIDNNIIDISNSYLYFGDSYHQNYFDGCFDDVRISNVARYTSVGISTTTTFTPPTQAYATSGTLTVTTDPPGDKYGEIGLGTSPTWTGTSGVTVTQQDQGEYRLTFTSSYTNADDYFVLTQPMDQGFAAYVGAARSTTHVDFTINRQSNNAGVDTGSLAVQVTNHP